MRKVELITDFNETLVAPWYRFFSPYPNVLSAIDEQLWRNPLLSVTTHMVSNTMDIFYRGGMRKYVEKIGVPLSKESVIINQSNFQTNLNHPLPSHVIERKIKAIQFICDEKIRETLDHHQNCEIILLGDNSSFDPQAYLAVARHYQKLIEAEKLKLQIHIHRFYQRRKLEHNSNFQIHYFYADQGPQFFL